MKCEKGRADRKEKSNEQIPKKQKTKKHQIGKNTKPTKNDAHELVIFLYVLLSVGVIHTKQHSLHPNLRMLLCLCVQLNL